MNEPRVEVDENACCSYGNCVDVAPGTFTLPSGSTTVQLTGSSAPDDDIAAAVRDCPTQALHLASTP